MKKYRIPSNSALVAFESAARNLNFSLAAEELNTSQSAISRHIKGIEQRFGARLFDRSRRKQHRLALTQEGEQYYRAVVNGLDGLHHATLSLAQSSESNQLTIACTHEASHLFLMPVFERLQQFIGLNTPIKIVVSEYSNMEKSLDPRTDLYFVTTKIEQLLTNDYHQKKGSKSTLIFSEQVQPICSPEYYRLNRLILDRPMREWGELSFLKLTKRGRGGANWSDWNDYFNLHQLTDLKPEFIPYYNYVYLLEAVATGRGIGLGWRYLIDRHLQSGVFKALADSYSEFENGFYAVITSKGQQHPRAQACIDFLCENTRSLAY